ncbi:MAG: SseB family protein [Bacteroidia bacterium]
MGLFDIFKKRRTDSTFPENELEKSLMQASSTSDASAQKAFYQKLLWNELFVLTGNNSNIEPGIQSLDESKTVQLVAFENGQIPVFTSTNRFFDKNIIQEEVPYLGMKGQDLFGLAKGATFILNPYSNHGKVLTLEEIESLLDGTIYDKIDEHELEKKKIEEFNDVFKRAAKRQDDLILIDGYQRKSLKANEKLKLEESVIDFQKCLSLIPDHWQSMVLMAKAFQRLERHTEAFEQLETAFKIELNSHSIPLEASLEAMHLKNIDKALFYSEEALKRKPNDPALMGNHAMNLLIAQKDMQAKNTIEEAIQIQPNDQVNKNIEAIVRSVISGNRKRPTFEDVVK